LDFECRQGRTQYTIEEAIVVKAILGYDIMPGMSIADYEKWLKEIHIPDLFKVPGLRKFVLNTVKGTVRGNTTFHRIAELHYDDMGSFERATKWREDNPVSDERSPRGKTDFKFYVVRETEEFDFVK
jgi:hypothetical protein